MNTAKFNTKENQEFETLLETIGFYEQGRDVSTEEKEMVKRLFGLGYFEQ